MKTALVTGGNRGLGLEIVKQLASKGFKVYLGTRDEAKAQTLIAALRKQKLNVEFLKLDVLKTSDIRAAHDRISSHEGRLDVLVNNAGVFLESLGNPDDSSIFKVDPVIMLKSIETNTMGPVKLIQSFIDLMAEDSRIINISSGMGSLNEIEGYYPGYRMSRTALNAMTLIMAKELGENAKVSINSICPGWCRTDMGGENASRSVTEGVQGVVWLATCENPPQGKFFRDKTEIPW